MDVHSCSSCGFPCRHKKHTTANGGKSSSNPSLLKDLESPRDSREQVTALLGKGLVIMAGREFGSKDVFLSNPRKELRVTWCLHSSITFSSLNSVVSLPALFLDPGPYHLSALGSSSLQDNFNSSL